MYKNKISSFIVFSVSVFLCFVTIGHSADKRIAIIDRDYILKNSTAAQAVRKSVETTWSKYQGDIKKKEETLRKSGKALASNQNKLSKVDFQKKKKVYEEKVAKLQTLIKDRKGTVDKAFQKGMKQVEDSFFQVVYDLMQEKDLEIVLYKSQIVMGKSELEVTDVVMKRLNKKLPKVKGDIFKN